MSATQLFAAGKLKEAIQAAEAEVKNSPESLERRGILCELLCYTGDFARIDKQLELVRKLSQMEQNVGTSLLQALIRSELHRRECYEQGRPPELAQEANEEIERRLKALLETREGNLDEANRLLTEAEAARPSLKIEVDGEAVVDFRDLDDLTSSLFEVLTSNGKYYWLPFHEIKELQFETPKTPLDFLWRPAQVDLREGPDDGQVYIAMLYPSSDADPDCQIGLKTEFVGGDGTPVRGVGRRMFLVGDVAKSLLDIHEIKVETDDGA